MSAALTVFVVLGCVAIVAFLALVAYAFRAHRQLMKHIMEEDRNER